jgi:hypothetical protein
MEAREEEDPWGGFRFVGSPAHRETPLPNGLDQSPAIN